MTVSQFPLRVQSQTCPPFFYPFYSGYQVVVRCCHGNALLYLSQLEVFEFGASIFENFSKLLVPLKVHERVTGIGIVGRAVVCSRGPGTSLFIYSLLVYLLDSQKTRRTRYSVLDVERLPPADTGISVSSNPVPLSR